MADEQVVEISPDKASEEHQDKISEKGKENMSEVELLKWEISLLKREKAVLEKERRCERENSIPPSTSDGINEGASSSLITNETQVFRMGYNEVNTLIPEFDPAKSEYSLQDWIKNIENLKDIYAWDERTVLFYGTLRLAGAARFWYLSKKTDIRSWKLLKTEITKSFPRNNDDSAILLQIMTRRKQPDECVEAYLYSVAALAEKINLPESSTIKYVISGLADQNLKNVLVAANFSSLNELLSKIKDYEEIEVQNRRRNDLEQRNTRLSRTPRSTFVERWNPQQVHSRNIQSQNRRAHNLPMVDNDQWKRTRKEDEKLDSNATKRPRFTTSGNEKKCFRCDKEGHIAASCPNVSKVRTCYKCNKPGHYARNCTLVGCITMNTKDKSEYYKDVMIKGKSILAYLDLGSECSTIKEENAAQLGLTMEQSEKTLYGFGGVPTRVVGVSSENVIVDNIEKAIEIAVVPNNTQTVPVIIGRNFMDSSDIKVVKSWGRYEILPIETNVKAPNTNDSSNIVNTTPDINMKQPSLFSDFTIEEVNVSTDTSNEDKVRLLHLINSYRPCFAENIKEIGRTNLIEMTITLKENKIVNYHPYRVAYTHKPILKSIVSELLSLDIIQPSTSEYASPVILVQKKNGDQRMCVDYRRLNSITRRETFPVPNIEETLNSLANKKIFTSLDLMSGYHQIPIAEESRHLTAFVTPDGHYEYKRVPFGLTNSPAVFMRLMATILQPLQCLDIISYMDDVLVASENVDKHLQVLGRLFEELKKANVTLNVKKCYFMSEKLSFLGHVISCKGIQPGDNKISAVANYKKPETVREVRQFLGLTGYFRRFVKNYALIASPLNRLLRKDVEFLWTEETERAFQQLKQVLVKRPVLTLYNETANHELHTDASSHGLAGILLQGDDKSILQPVSYYSRATTSVEAKYHSYELEALAVVESLERFKYYLLHKKFKIVTDCNSLRLTQEKKNLIPRISRWWMKISEFDFELEFRAGKKMAHVDALSRNPVEQGQLTENVAEEMLVITIPEEDWLAGLQQQDPWLQEIRKVLEGTIQQHANLNGIKGTYVLVKGRIYKKTPTGEKFFVPRGIRWRVIQSAHDRMGHLGIEKTLDNLRKTFWFPNMKPIVTKYINSCIECLYHKQVTKDQRYQLYTYERLAVPFHTVHCDFLGPFPKSKKGNIHVIGLVDAFSKFIVLKPTRSTSTKEVIRMMDEITQYFGVPTQLVTDRGSAFTSKEFTRYCADNVIKHVLTAVQTPRANGQIERYFKTAKNSIATMSQDEAGRDWDINIPAIQWSLNSLKHLTTKKTPHEILMAYKPRSILKNKLILALHDTDENAEDENIPLSELREVIKKRIRDKQQLQVDAFNTTHKPPKKYIKGDLVLIKQEAPATGQPRKLLPRYKGPYQVKAVLPHDRYVITDLDMIQISQKPYESIHAVDHLKSWCNLSDLCFDDESDEEEVCLEDK